LLVIFMALSSLVAGPTATANGETFGSHC
jgi:hypothetical protein